MKFDDETIEMDVDKMLSGELNRKLPAKTLKKSKEIALSRAPGLKPYTMDKPEAMKIDVVKFRKERAGKIYLVEVGCSFQLDEVTIKSIKIYRNSNHVETRKVIDSMGREIFKNFIKNGIYKELMGRSLIFANASLE